VESYSIILVNGRAISRYGFLNELTWKLVMSSGTIVGSSKHLGKRSNLLLFFLRNCLEYFPLNVNVGSDNINI
jgi:hypothetical protein